MALGSCGASRSLSGGAVARLKERSSGVLWLLFCGFLDLAALLVGELKILRLWKEERDSLRKYGVTEAAAILTFEVSGNDRNRHIFAYFQNIKIIREREEEKREGLRFLWREWRCGCERGARPTVSLPGLPHRDG